MLDVGEITRVVASSPAVLPALTRSCGEARELLSRRYKDHAIEVAGDGRDFDFLHASATVAPGSFNILRYGSGVAIDPGDFDQFYMLEIPLSGGVELRFRDRICASDTGHGLIISPGSPLVSLWRPGTVQMMLKIDRHFVLHRLRTLAARPVRTHPVFEPDIDLAQPGGWRIQGLMTLLLQDFLASMTGSGWDFAKSTLPTAIVDALLLTVEHDHGAGMRAAVPEILPRHVKRCVRYIDENFAEDISVARLAGIAEASERTLYEGFRNFLDTSPQQYLTERRLKAAREILLAGNQPVAAVARLCGFHHPSRFAKLYRERYLEYPSQTAKH